MVSQAFVEQRVMSGLTIKRLHSGSENPAATRASSANALSSSRGIATQEIAFALGSLGPRIPWRCATQAMTDARSILAWHHTPVHVCLYPVPRPENRFSVPPLRSYVVFPALPCC